MQDHKIHYRMYKTGKRWIVVAMFSGLLFTGFKATNMVSHAAENLDAGVPSGFVIPKDVIVDKYSPLTHQATTKETTHTTQQTVAKPAVATITIPSVKTTTVTTTSSTANHRYSLTIVFKDENGQVIRTVNAGSYRVGETYNLTSDISWLAAVGYRAHVASNIITVNEENRGNIEIKATRMHNISVTYKDIDTGNVIDRHTVIDNDTNVYSTAQDKAYLTSLGYSVANIPDQLKGSHEHILRLKKLPVVIPKEAPEPEVVSTSSVAELPKAEPVVPAEKSKVAAPAPAVHHKTKSAPATTRAKHAHAKHDKVAKLPQTGDQMNAASMTAIGTSLLLMAIGAGFVDIRRRRR
ncbi:LPXTG cell wall anchor domain-containing protein [Apilactobacillus bombintestini]|uniref:LPXTG cell wall anchor domain-containing protein n=1 Tax=Apilactobacillus bombintestini TaxID=2419772 RepID=A0A387AQL4_9LACO|nr:LPXTG cell wall anchor domain-containing protein [Apilactobacillus bombintestini]AYF93064.1 LPXTG cell wall anchor domain-containing protein [Apilactobacillus bombintestini]